MAARPVRRADFIMLLAYATDLATGAPRDFARRGCVLNMRLAAAAGYDVEARRAVFHQALLLAGRAEMLRRRGKIWDRRGGSRVTDSERGAGGAMSTTIWWMLAAVLLQGVLTLLALGVLSAERVWLLNRGRVDARDVRLTRDAWPDVAKQASNTFDNQFQLPVLFYVAAAVSVFLVPNWIELGLAWAFALSRWGHAIVYIAVNHVPTRATFFSIGYAALIVWWIELIVRLFTLGVPGG